MNKGVVRNRKGGPGREPPSYSPGRSGVAQAEQHYVRILEFKVPIKPALQPPKRDDLWGLFSNCLRSILVLFGSRCVNICD